MDETPSGSDSSVNVQAIAHLGAAKVVREEEARSKVVALLSKDSSSQVTSIR